MIQGARSTKTQKKEVGTFFINDNFVGLFLNLYGRSTDDLTGFCQSFRKVILKNHQRQTKSYAAIDEIDSVRYDDTFICVVILSLYEYIGAAFVITLSNIVPETSR